MNLLLYVHCFFIANIDTIFGSRVSFQSKNMSSHIVFVIVVSGNGDIKMLAVFGKNIASACCSLDLYSCIFVSPQKRNVVVP